MLPEYAVRFRTVYTTIPMEPSRPRPLQAREAVYRLLYRGECRHRADWSSDGIGRSAAGIFYAGIFFGEFNKGSPRTMIRCSFDKKIHHSRDEVTWMSKVLASRCLSNFRDAAGSRTVGCIRFIQASSVQNTPSRFQNFTFCHRAHGAQKSPLSHLRGW